MVAGVVLVEVRRVEEGVAVADPAPEEVQLGVVEGTVQEEVLPAAAEAAVTGEAQGEVADPALEVLCFAAVEALLCAVAVLEAWGGLTRTQ